MGESLAALGAERVGLVQDRGDAALLVEGWERDLESPGTRLDRRAASCAPCDAAAMSTDASLCEQVVSKIAASTSRLGRSDLEAVLMSPAIGSIATLPTMLERLPTRDSDIAATSSSPSVLRRSQLVESLRRPLAIDVALDRSERRLRRRQSGRASTADAVDRTRDDLAKRRPSSRQHRLQVGEALLDLGFELLEVGDDLQRRRGARPRRGRPPCSG